MTVEKLIKKFDIEGEVVDVAFNNTGNINRTFVVSVMNNGVIKKYALQKINTNVFTEPYLLMDNIENVTNYCRDYFERNNEDASRRSLQVIRTKDNNNLYRTSDNEFYRVYNFVDNTRTYDKAENAAMFYNVGIAFGDFALVLDGYPMDTLYETIPNFHNSKARYKDFLYSIKKDPCDRVKEVEEEIKFIKDRAIELETVVNLIEEGVIPVRVTHNDTKINNVLIDIDSNEAICVVDLDTVMPGCSLYDFGDAIRSGASKTVEDDPNIDNVGVNLEFFTAFTEAYLSRTKDILTEEEIKYLAFSCRLLTLELAMRFLTDYLNGNTYFKCDYEKHNLVRCRNQIALVEDMEKHKEEMEAIVKNVFDGKKEASVCKKYVNINHQQG